MRLTMRIFEMSCTFPHLNMIVIPLIFITQLLEEKRPCNNE